MNPFVIPTKFTAIDGVSSTVKGMSVNVHDAFSKFNSTLARQNKMFRMLSPGIGGATKQLLSYASAGTLLGGLAFSGKAIMDNETAFQSLSAVTGVVGKDFQNMKKEVNQLAADSKKSSTDVAGSFEVVGSAMSQYLKNPKALHEIAEGGILLAKASRTEVVPTIEDLTSIMNQYNLVAGQTKETVNRLTAGEIVGSLRTSQVAEALKEVGANAFSANVTLSESVALVEALAKQMRVDKIGVGARNILTVMDSAKGLDKKARHDLRKAGVDLGFLMDKSKTLSERLHELSKISGNSVAITSVFGKENKTAAQVIFNQLGTYDQYHQQILKTNEAQRQASTNSNTLKVAVDELKNTWINYLVANDSANKGLEKSKEAIHFVTENIDSIVSSGITLLKFYAMWKAALITGTVLMTGYNVVIGVQGALTGIAAINIGKSSVALGTYNLVTKLTTASTWNLNAAIAANPVGALLVGITAVTAGLIYLSKREDELNEKYRDKIRIDAVKNLNDEASALDNLAKKYFMLGHNIQKANSMAVAERKLKIDTDRSQVEKNISQIQSKLKAEKDKFTLGDVLAGTFGEEWKTGKEKDLAEELLKQQEKARKLADQNLSVTEYAKAGIDAKVLNQEDLGTLFARPKPVSTKPQPMYDYFNPESAGGADKKYFMDFDYTKLREALYAKEQKIVIEFKNAPPGTTAISGSGVSSPNSY